MYACMDVFVCKYIHIFLSKNVKCIYRKRYDAYRVSVYLYRRCCIIGCDTSDKEPMRMLRLKLHTNTAFIRKASRSSMLTYWTEHSYSCSAGFWIHIATPPDHASSS